MKRDPVSACLLALAVGLLLVGVVNATPIRHAMQAAPALALLVVPARARAWAAFAAFAVFLFWLAVMSLIWLYLLGLARIITGTFTPTETLLTIVIGGAGALGIVAVIRGREPSPAWKRGAAFVVAAAIQVGATWLSVQPGFATR